MDEKIGTFPVVDEILAERNSVNKPAGTLLLSPLSLTAKEYLIQVTRLSGGLFDKFKGKMPWMQKFTFIE